MQINKLNQNPTYKSTNNAEKIHPKQITAKKQTDSKIGNSWTAWNIGALLVEMPNLLLGNFVLKKMSLENVNLPKEDVETIRDSAEKILDKTGLRDKGVFIKYWKRLKEVKTLDDILILFSPLGEVRTGRNAFFSSRDIYVPKMVEKNKEISELLIKKNSINMPNGNLNTQVFHEIGHAYNHHLSKLGKLAQAPIFRSATWIAAILSILVAFSSKRAAKNNEELSVKDKIHNAARNYAPLVPLTLSIPMLAEEWSATVKGENWAKEYLPTKLFAGVKKANRFAMGSYIASATTAIASVFIVRVLKDYLNQKNEGEKSPQE